ncbi:MAG: hypothetical protein ABJB47_13410, partial [Actinomycetota bacterium]
MSPVSPVTKAARHAQIAGILEQAAVRSQEELAEWLARRGVKVTQATLSRDLVELGAVRLRGPDGGLVYALPDAPGGPGSLPGSLAGGPDDDAVEGATPPGVASAHSASSHSASSHSARPGTASPGGRQGFAPPGTAWPGAEPSRLARSASELLVSAEASANLVVLRTPAGAAQFLASVIDHARWPSILGTVAGDDTVLIIARDPAGGQ